MSTFNELYTLIGNRIGDPDHDEVDTGDASTMMSWINVVLSDITMLTDCLQKSGTITGDGAAESFVATLLPNLLHIISVTDKVNERVYLPVKRSEYQGYRNLLTPVLGGLYVYSLFGYSALGRKIYFLPVVPLAIDITVEYSETHTVIVDSTHSPAGILDQYDSMIVSGVERMYWNSSGDSERSQMAFDEYMGWVGRLAKELGINPEVEPEMSMLWRGKT